MGIKGSDGFTIIEIMLFLGISGLMIFGILAGTGTAINQQRYRDSVNSLAMRLQQQYDDINGVQNARSANWTCTNGLPEDTNGVAGVSRGASDCAILGQYVVASDASLAVQPVVGQTASTTNVKDDVAAITAMKPVMSDKQRQVYPLEWNAHMVQQGAGSTVAASFSMLIVRSPLSGGVRTFTANGVVSVNELIKAPYLNQGVTVCVDSGGLFTGPRQAVTVAAGAVSAAGVTIDGTETNGC
jgi:type II secretory pathway pseudopilin PulG